MKQILKRFWTSFSGYGKFGMGAILFMVCLCFISFFFLENLHKIPSGNALEAPSLDHWLGTDDLGIDIFAQICHGAVISMLVGFSTALLAGIGGSSLGILAGYYGKWIDKLITGLCDVMMSIPQLPLMIVLGAFFGASLTNIVLVIALLSWVGPARTARSKVLAMRHENFIAAAKSYGAGFRHLAVKHFIPGLLPIISVGMIRIVSHAVVAEAGLSFLGLGDPLSKSWGIILNRSINFPGIYFTDFWKWWIMSPLAALLILVVAVAFISRDLEKIVNTKI
ncbi:ABC transporter permease [Desulfitobacterium chlororespirans]|uniref:Peptide/nickel transport system permease protein n=1 Tax=Desulfitobacterium chlororespirans DSM 11544 TaxID=1121395 RepID=A0A1M7URI5_9FIRM|nr:ABC transporter permease [Desulfitobacterium chlororespirans]SHN85653.1 peptide/nickel transport system permease protein [Desulfitobacterium chlororespirans DSM 11544]